MITAQDLVRREVHYCVSSLVSTLASEGLPRSMGDLCQLTEQAAELAAPVLDYESAAREAGYRLEDSQDHPGTVEWVGPDGDREGFFENHDEAWQAACGDGDVIDPHEHEVYEHWIVSDWLADRLEEKGEKVDRDFAGLTVWARTTTGRAVHADHVIEQIHADLTREG